MTSNSPRTQTPAEPFLAGGCFVVCFGIVIEGCSPEGVREHVVFCLLQAWRRPTLPRLETKYHWRWGDLRPSSGWDRVWTPRQSHQAGERQKGFEHMFSGANASRKRAGFGWRVGANAPLHARCGLDIDNESDQADRTISTSQLHALPRFHIWPINVVVFHGSQGSSCFEVGFPLRCLQRLSRPHIATLHCRWRDNRSTGGVFIPVLSY